MWILIPSSGVSWRLRSINLGQLGMGAQILSVFRARLLLHQRHILLEGHRLAIQAFDRDQLDKSPRLPDLEALLGGVHPARDPLASQGPAHVVVLMIDRQVPTGAYHASKGMLMHRPEPAIRINHLRYSRQRRELLTGHTRWLVATRARLIGSLAVVMREKCLSELTDLRERAWPMHLQAFLTKRAVKSLDVRIQIGSMWGDDIGYHPKTEQEAHQRGREIASGRAANQTGIIVKREHPRQAMLAEKPGHHLKECFGIEIAAHLAVQPDRGASIDKIGNLDHMLLLPFWISGHTAGVFEIELDFLSRMRCTMAGWEAMEAGGV
jgi:hypothetical protein